MQYHCFKIVLQWCILAEWKPSNNWGCFHNLPAQVLCARTLCGKGDVVGDECLEGFVVEGVVLDGAHDFVGIGGEQGGDVVLQINVEGSLSLVACPVVGV